MPRSEAGCAEGPHVFLANKLLLWHLGVKTDIHKDTPTQIHMHIYKYTFNDNS